MIQMGTKLLVADNSGAKIVKCIKILGGSKKMIGKIGDIIILSIKKTIMPKKIKEGSIWKGIIVRTKYKHKRKDGTSIKLGENAVILLDKDKNIIGTRIFGCIPKEIKERGMNKIISLAPEII